MQHIGTVVAASLSIRSSSHGGRLVNQPVSITSEDYLPPLSVLPLDRDLLRVVEFWEGGGVVSGAPVLRRPFNGAEQSALERRVHELRCAVAPFDGRNRDALLQEISGMLGGFPTMQRFDQVAALSMAAAYLLTARERPHWAIIKACRMVRGGTAGLAVAYCPSEPEFNTLIGRRVEPYADKLRRMQRLLDAKAEPPTPPKLTREEIEARLGRPLGRGAVK
jgi:hypothetical protein